MSNNFLLVGTVSDVENHLVSDVGMIEKSIRGIGNLEIFLVESDSTDKTLNILENLRLKNSNFSYTTFGQLKNKYPQRTERIRFCRNAYVDYIQKNLPKKKWDYIIIADLDGMNSSITEKRVNQSLSKESRWDACFANQTLGYYDLYALRADKWVEKDCFYELKEMQRAFPFRAKCRNSFLDFLFAFQHFDGLRNEIIYKRMKRLRGDLVPVKSAFGGFGIYKSKVFQELNYSKIDTGEKSECEHLDLHYKCLQNGFRLFIDPRLINNHINVYNLNKFKLIRFLREYKKYISRKPI
jgi:glycosyltransferase involved in cell wall biosynthesis